MIQLTNEIEYFEELTQFPLGDYLTSFVNFVEGQYLTLVDFYKGSITEKPVDILGELESLTKDYGKINDLVNIYKNEFTSTSYWELIELIDNIGIELGTLNNLSKWLRSSVVDSKYSEGVEVEELLKQNETIEQMARRLGFSDEQNDWVSIAQRNDVREEDYADEDGNVFLVTYRTVSDSIQLESVVDNISGTKIYGKDLPKQISFDSIENDLSVLTYKETILQAANILIGLFRGQVPEFPDDGIQRDLVVGSNIGSITYPSIFRQLYSVFGKDDTFKEIGIENIQQENDGIVIELLVKTRLNEVISENIVIS